MKMLSNSLNIKCELFYDSEKSQTIIRLLEDLKVGDVIIPKGFESDGCSSPSFLWYKIPKIDARYIDLYIRHDYAYSTHYTSKEKADQELRIDLIKRGMRSSLAYEIYLGVYWFGYSHW